MRRLIILGMGLLAAGIIFMAPASAFAQSSSTCQAYSSQTCGVSGVSGTSGTSTSPTSTVSSSSSSLPFTGLDAALLAAGGIGLVAFGLVVRRIVGRERLQ